jgi:hypothetical protein
MLLGYVVVDREVARAEVSFQRLGIVLLIADRARQRTLGQHLRSLRFQPSLEALPDRDRTLLADPKPDRGPRRLVGLLG